MFTEALLTEPGMERPQCLSAGEWRRGGADNGIRFRHKQGYPAIGDNTGEPGRYVKQSKPDEKDKYRLILFTSAIKTFLKKVKLRETEQNGGGGVGK